MRTALVAAVAAASVALGISGAAAYSQRQAALEAQAQAYQQRRAEAAAAAWVAYEQLSAADSGASFMGHAAEFARARTPSDFDLLRRRWTIEAEAARLDLAFLAGTGGGLDGALPHDLAVLGASIEGAAQDAAGLDIDTDPASDLARALDGYSRLTAPERVAEHDALRDQLAAGLQVLATRVAARRDATSLAGRVDDLVALASTIGIPADLAQRVGAAKALAASARSDGDVRAADQQLQSVTAALNAIVNRTDGAPLPPCLAPGQPSHLILIHLATQQLVAYQDGCPWLATPVTTGRPALPTDRGTFSIFYKSVAYKMVSPWPLGSPFYYPPTWVYYAMEFVGDGTFIHNADWQPDGTYGPGSQYGPYASHGCVHVRDAVLPGLFAWAPVGTVVTVED